MDQGTKQQIRQAFKAGQLRVRAALPDGIVGLHEISDILQHKTSHKRMWEVRTESQAVVCTEDHSLFTFDHRGLLPITTRALEPGMPLAVHSGNVLQGATVLTVLPAPQEEYTYDLSVLGPQNFFLTNGVLAHNSYSIGGVSLDIEKSSKYESMKQNSETQFEKATESKQRTVKFIRGLQQPRFGMGVRSSFGPHLGRGLLSPRNFV